MNDELVKLLSMSKSLKESEYKYVEENFIIWLSQNDNLHYVLDGQHTVLKNKTIADFKDVVINYLSV